jgi:hypothetical protein
MTWNLGDYTWTNFEKTKNGRLSIGGTQFYMRVGLFMGRPTQVIQTHGEFVKMRLVKGYPKGNLQVLDPTNNKACLYHAEGWGTFQWKPPTGFVNLNELVKTTLRNCTGELAKNIQRNNALLKKLSARP